MKKAILIVALLLAVCCGAYLIYEKANPPQIRNVLLISMDTTRSDRLRCYGFDKNTTPNIDALSAEGILFENTVSPIPLTLPAHSSMMTGTYPTYHKVFDNMDFRLASPNLTLAEILSQNGFTTSAAVGAFVLDKSFGLEQGFDHYDDNIKRGSETSGELDERDGSKISDIAIKWLEEKKDEKFFMFLHYFDPHYPYQPPEPFKSQFAGDTYSGEIAYTDHCIGRVIDKLKTLGLYDSTLIVLTGDHGEMLGEHGEASHSYFIYQSAIKVPLIFKLPRGTGAKRINRLVGIVDILPTVCSLLGIDLPSHVQGRDISPLFDNAPADDLRRNFYLETRQATKYNGNALFGLINDEYKYIHTTRPELYDIVNDPYEKNNLFKTSQQRARIMKDELMRIMEQTPDKDKSDSRYSMDSDAIKSLQSLGYVSGTVYEGNDLDVDGDDPKDLLSFHIRVMEIGPLVGRNQFDKARRMCRKLIQEKPDYYGTYYDLSVMAMAEKKYEDAAKNLLEVIKIKPEHAPALKNLGKAYMYLKRYDKAIEYFNKALEIKPDYTNVHYHLGQVYYKQEDYEKVIKHTREALKLGPKVASDHLKLAMAYSKTGQHDLAFEEFTNILDYEPDNINVLNSMAWTIATNKELAAVHHSEAIDCALKATELTSHKNAGVLDTLAAAYAAAGDFDRAIETAQKAISLATADGNDELVQAIEEKLKLYTASLAYYQEH